VATDSVLARILVVDYEPAVCEALEVALTLRGYQVIVVDNGEEALRRVGEAHPDAIVLDVLMPGIDGFEVCRRLRASHNRTPILLLTARDEVDDRVTGLDVGADDYLVKPFAREELLARLRALLRRAGGDAEARVLRFADLSLDLGSQEACRGDRVIELTRTEFLLLELFLHHPRQVLTRSIIFERVWGFDFGPSSNSLEVFVGFLRKKTEAGGKPRLIHTKRGVGYVLREP